MANLSHGDRKRFRAIGHKLRPVVTLGNRGLTPAVQAEIDRALSDHELIKIRINAEKAERRQLAERITTALGAELVVSLGGVSLIYRPAETVNVKLSNLHRLDVF